MVDTNQYIKDRMDAEKIKEVIKDMCEIQDEYLEVDGKRCLYSDILKCSIQNEDANFKGKTKPFTHTILGQTPFMAGAIEPMMYVGIKLTLKDCTVLPIYVSKKKALLNSDMYLSDLKETKSILLKIQERIG